MDKNRFDHLPSDLATQLNIGLLIVEAAVEHTRAQTKATHADHHRSGVYATVSATASSSTQAA